MFIFDEESLGFLAVHQAALRTYGWSEDEFLALSVLDVRPPEERELARPSVGGPNQWQRSRPGIGAANGKGNGFRWFHLSVRPLGCTVS